VRRVRVHFSARANSRPRMISTGAYVADCEAYLADAIFLMNVQETSVPRQSYLNG
jgi:hypothetical protein